jgi:hypothetical protein
MSKVLRDPPRRRLTSSERRALATAEVCRFVQQYERKAQKGVEPNDRRYDRKVEKKVKRMRPDQLDSLLRNDEG